MIIQFNNLINSYINLKNFHLVTCVWNPAFINKSHHLVVYTIDISTTKIAGFLIFIYTFQII